MEYRDLLVAVDDRIARVTLNRPDRRNALSLDLLDQLGAALGAIGDDPDIAAVVIEGAGPAFSSGHDLNEMLGRDPDFYSQLFDRCTEVMLGIQAMRQPVIAKVHGMATAAGCQLVASCDLGVAASDCGFATPGVRIGLFCSTPMIPITRSIGRKRALEMLLTGEPIDASTALQWGLVNRVVPAAQLESAVEDLLAQITRFSRDVIAIGKGAFYAQIDATETEGYAITAPIMSENARHRDAQEGISAFLDKRDPKWGSS